MTEPIIFTAAEPLILRPRAPQGFTIETKDGRVIYACAVPYEQITFRLAPAPNDQIKDAAVLTVEMTWVEA